MVWTPFTRVDHDRSRLRYASDTSDEEWRGIAPQKVPGNWAFSSGQLNHGSGVRAP